MYTDQERDHMVFDLISCAHEGMAKAAAIHAAKQQQDREVEAMIPNVLDALVTNRRIAPGETVKVAGWLRNQATTLQFLAELAAHDNSVPSGKLGSTVKKANLQSGTTHKQREDEILEEFFQSYDL